MDYLNAIISILSGLAVCIPLVTKLVEVIQNAAKEKNWNTIVKMTFDYMASAQVMFEKGADRKEWVIGMVKASATQANYPLDEEALEKISKMIDDTCDLAKELTKPKQIENGTEA